MYDMMANIPYLKPVTISSRQESPVFMCATPTVAAKSGLETDPWVHCTKSTRPDERATTSYWLEDSATVIICPAFLRDLRPEPPLTPDGPRDVYCPIVRQNLFVGRSFPLVRYQVYDLIRQLVKLYLQGGALGPETEPREEVDWNSCVGLGYGGSGLGPSERNPMNYVYYAACEWSALCGGLRLMLCLVVNQDCTQAPNPTLPPFSVREDVADSNSAGF